ncbi:MAG TPA: peptidase M23, partial [Glaciecola sp.]|nr:peptidase M23 [Glaciecola sp.]
MVSQTIKTLPKPHKISLVALIIIVFILTISMLFSADASRHATSQVLQP